MKTQTLLALMSLAAISISANAANPFLPLWEYIPDGEPYVFEDPDAPGKMRVYVYGSHDNLRDKWEFTNLGAGQYLVVNKEAGGVLNRIFFGSDKAIRRHHRCRLILYP